MSQSITCQYYKKLQGWTDRENDGLYKTLPIDCRPLSPRVGIKDFLKVINTELNDVSMMITMIMMTMNSRNNNNQSSYKQIKMNSIQNLIELINKCKVMYEKN